LGFGIVVLDIERIEIADTYKIGPDGSDINVLDFTYEPNTDVFYAATEQGIYKASGSDANLAYYESWTKIDDIEELLQILK